MRFKLGKKLTTFLICFGTVSLIGFILTLWIGSNVILHPKRRALEERHVLVNQTPANYGMELEGFVAETHDNHSLKGFLVYPATNLGEAKRTRRMLTRLKQAGVGRRSSPRGTVILLHGRGGMKENMLTIAQRFVAADFRCIVYDARAHGESGGSHTTFGKLERRDVGTVLDHIETILQKRGEHISPVVGFGLSQGAAVMLQTIPQEPRITAAIATAPFADLREETIYAIGNVSKGRVPIFLRTALLKTACLRGGFRATDVVPERSAKDIKIPVFVVHGKLDKVIPIDQARRIFQSLPSENRQWQEIPGAYHSNLLAEGGDDLYETMIHFYLKSIGS